MGCHTDRLIQTVKLLDITAMLRSNPQHHSASTLSPWSFQGPELCNHCHPGGHHQSSSPTHYHTTKVLLISQHQPLIAKPVACESALSPSVYSAKICSTLDRSHNSMLSQWLSGRHTAVSAACFCTCRWTAATVSLCSRSAVSNSCCKMA